MTSLRESLLRAASRVAERRLLYVITVALAIGYFLTPYFLPRLESLEAQPECRAEQSQAVSLVLRAGQRTRTSCIVSNNPLVETKLTFGAVGHSGGLEVLPTKVEPRIRLDNLLLFLAAVALIPLFVRELATSSRTEGALRRPDKAQEGLDAPLRSSASWASAEDFLAADVRVASILAAALFRRSTLLLSGGIAMALVGVGIFYISLPKVAITQEVSLSVLPHVLRPIGILLFVEGIAWFLLRQYRALIEDYKTFHRYYLRRANLFIALKILSPGGAPEQNLVLAAAFIHDDLSTRLNAGQTTETLEALRQTEPNPVFEMLGRLIELGKTKS